MISLQNKTILITGASSGIGRATAIQLSQLGASVALNGRNDKELQNTANACAGKPIVLKADLCNEEEVSHLIELSPKLNGWVHCTGKVLPVPVKFIQEKHLEEILNVNFKSAVKLTSALLRGKKLNDGSSILFISSVSVLHSYFGGGPYIASKAALEAHARTMALELASKKIRVNVLQPALVKTAIYQATSEAAMNQQEMEEHEKKYPLGIGEPEDVAKAAAFFISDESSWITGSSLKMDGGLTLGFSAK